MASIQHLNAYIDAFKIKKVVAVIEKHQDQHGVPDYFSLICKTPLFSGCPGTDIYCF